MSKFKTGRIEMLDKTVKALTELLQLYNQASPGWTLLRAAIGHINSLYHLEAETNFDDETLGVRFRDNNEEKK